MSPRESLLIGVTEMESSTNKNQSQFWLFSEKFKKSEIPDFALFEPQNQPK